MTYYKNLIVTGLTILLSISLSNSFAQSLPSCELPVKAEAVDATKGRNNGQINFELGSELRSRNIKIFLSDPFANTPWKEVDNDKARGLKAGFYDLLIVDTSRKECAKQFTVEIKSK